jgi:hypothetical protein
MYVRMLSMRAEISAERADLPAVGGGLRLVEGDAGRWRHSMMGIRASFGHAAPRLA